MSKDAVRNLVPLKTLVPKIQLPRKLISPLDNKEKSFQTLFVCFRTELIIQLGITVLICVLTFLFKEDFMILNVK